MKCLLLDDRPEQRERLQTLTRLAWAEAEFVTAAGPAELGPALAQAEVVLLADHLAWGDGLALARDIKARRPELPVIMIADPGDAEAAVQGLRAGLSDYIARAHLARLPDALRAAVAAAPDPEGHYRRLAELAADYGFMLAVPPSGPPQIAWASEGFERFTGYRPDGRTLDDLLDAVVPDDQPLVREHFAQLLAGRPHTAEARVATRAGAVRWMLSLGLPIPGPDGRARRVYVAVRDITLRKEVESAERDQRFLAEALRDTAAALNSTLHYDYLLERVLLNVGRVVPHEAADIMFIDDRDGAGPTARFVRWQGFDRHGLDDAWLTRQRFPVERLAHIRQVLRSQLPVVVPDTQADPSWTAVPELAWVRSVVSAPIMVHDAVIGLIDALSAQPGFFSSTHADRLLAFADQAGVAIYNAQLYDSVQQQAGELAALYRASAALVGTPATVAELAQRITDTLAAEFQFAHVAIGLVEAATHELVFIAYTGHAGVDLNLRLPLDGPGLTVAAVAHNAVVYAPDVHADPRYVRVNPASRSELVVPLRAGERLLGVLDLQGPEVDAFSVRDRRLITAFAERAALALQNALLLRDLQRAQQAAEAANRAKTEFLANTSHELRTPLAGVIGALDLVLDDLCESREEERQFIAVARQASSHLLGLINNLLDLSKVEAGRVELLFQEVDIDLLLAEAITLFKPQANEKPLAIDLAPSPPGLPTVWADHGRVRQILLNLLDNAVKFTPQGRIRLSTEVVEPAPGARRVRVTIQDTGIGIPPDQQDKLFQPFTQVDGSTTRRFGGTGLGLSISRRLAELMHGTLELHSLGEGQGTTFTLTLPAARSDGPPA